MATKREKADTVRRNLTKAIRENLHEVRHYLNSDAEERIGVRVNCPIYPKDPTVARLDPDFGVEDISVAWEPGLADGPTNARFAVVDYNADTGELTPPVTWDPQENRFVNGEGVPLTPENPEASGFHQVNAWAIAQWVLEFFETPWSLGRAVPWGFDGNRLIIVPRAGYGENAFYDRRSKSLQLYYFGDPTEPKYTSLSHDIVAHETGHAVLDGLRPLYYERSSPQTAAFHEFIGDMTAILSALRHRGTRNRLAEIVIGERPERNIAADLAREFGEHLNDRREQPYVRTALNSRTLGDVVRSNNIHAMSEVLTGAMFSILMAIAGEYVKRPREGRKPISRGRATWYAVEELRRIAIQPLDLCPPVDIQFLDYARAVMYNFRLADPADERGFRDLMSGIFHRRGLCGRSKDEHADGYCDLQEPRLPRPSVYYDVERIAGSRTDAYNFLHDNRRAFKIPPQVDISVTDLYTTHKMGSAARRLPVEVVLGYVWREPVRLEGKENGPLQGESVDLLCGGTLVLDGLGNIRSWFRKPGTEFPADREEGERRRRELLAFLVSQIRSGRAALVGEVEAESGLPLPPVVIRKGDGAVRLETTPQLRESEDDEPVGEEEWATSF